MTRWIDLLKRSALRVLRHRHFLAGCFVAALVVRLLFIALFDAQPLSDFVWYFQKGLQIAHGQGYVVTDDGFPLWGAGHPLDVPKPTAFWPVGYPGFLAVLFFATPSFIAPLTAAKIANAVLYVIAIGAAAYSADLIFPSKSRLAAKITALLLAFWPNHVAYTTLTSVEIYFVFLTACGIALMLVQHDRKRLAFAAAAGACFGLAILTKPQALFLPAAIMLAIYFRNLKQALRPLVVLYAVALLCVLPWSFRNYQAFDGRFVFVSNNGGINLLISNMPGSWGYSGLMWNKELDAIISTTKDEVQRDRQAKDVAVDYAVHNIGPLLKMFPGKLIGLYASDVDGFGWNQSAVAAYGNAPIWKPLRIISESYYLAIAALAFGCFWRNRRSRRPSYWAGPMLMLYFTGICLVFTGGPRFHFPMVPWFAAYAAGLLAAWLEPQQLPPAEPSR